MYNESIGKRIDCYIKSPIVGKTFVLVGAGGAGRALAFGAKSRGAQVVIFNRNYGNKAILFSPF